MTRLAAALLMIVWTLTAALAGSRGATSIVPESPGPKPFSVSRALVIGIDGYDRGWPALSEARRDARAVAEGLQGAGFDEITLLLDPDAVELERAVKQFVYVEGADPDARLLIWFAGHGHTIGGEGYLVPRDAPHPGATPAQEAAFQAAALPLVSFARYMSEVKARHVLAVFDSCFSGSVFNASRASVPASVEKSAGQVARQFIASGSAGEEALDDGAFRAAFLDALQGRDRAALTPDGYLTGARLGAYLAERISRATGGRQNPIYSTSNVVGQDRGDFVFPMSFLSVEEGGGTIPVIAQETAPAGSGKVAPELRIEAFAVEGQDADLAFLADKLARNLVEYCVDNKLYVSSALTGREPARPPTHRIVGRLARDGSRATVSADLLDADGGIAATAEFGGEIAFLRQNYKVLPETLQYLLDISLLTLYPLYSAARPTESGEAYAHFLAARQQAARGRLAEAADLVEAAVEIDPMFAAGYGVLAQLAERRGDTAKAAELRETALGLDPDYQPLNIFAGRLMGDPVPALREAAAASAWQAAGPGLEFRRVESADYGVSLLAWRFDQKLTGMRAARSPTSKGETASELRSRTGGLVAVNAGFFDLDLSDRLSPVGLLVIDGREINPFDALKARNPLTGILFGKEGRVGIIPARLFTSSAGYEWAVQTGPLVVDPGGHNGIYRNAYDRQNRTVVCLGFDGTPAVVVVSGGLSLYETGELLSASQADGGFGCERAINMDGGPSTQASMLANGIGLELPGLWRVGSGLVLSPGQSALPADAP